jgi:hypothetical protein
MLGESVGQTFIGDYVPPPDTPKNVFGGFGKAVVGFRTLPVYYKDLAEWIDAARKTAPESVESRLSVRNRAIADQSVTCLRAPAGPRMLYASYFFQVGQTPVLLELTYGAQDPKRVEYQSAVLGMIGGAQTVK